MASTNIPEDHPRAKSLLTREAMKRAVEDGLVHATGLIAHGRGEAFDYLLGEATGPAAARAIHKAAELWLAAERPVISLNGNVVALAAGPIVELARAHPCRLEVNLFHHTPERVAKLIQAMEAVGATDVLGAEPDMRIPGLSSDRGPCCSEGIGNADVVLVPLEDGDRCEALKAMGKTVITIDLNPLSRTSRAADVTICDELTRAIPHLVDELERHERGDAEASESLRSRGPRGVLDGWDNEANLRAVGEEMAARLVRD